MPKRPISIIVISWLFIAAGVVGLSYHASEFDIRRPFHPEFAWICAVRLLAIACGVFMLRGRNWARWVLLLWLAYHVGLSALHHMEGFIIHSLLLAVIAYFLLRPQAAVYFRERLR